MDRELKVYIDRLGGEHEEEICESLSPAFIDVEEKDLQFSKPVQIKGKAYLAEHHLVIHLDIETVALIPCSICNAQVEQKISLKSFYHTEELENIKGQIYDYTNLLREAILLEVPSYVECKGNCPERDRIKNYLHKGEVQFPFADLGEK